MLACWPEALEIIWARHHARRWGPCGPGPVIAGEGSSTDRAPTSGGPLRARVAPVALALGLPLSSVRQDIQRHWFLQTFIYLGRSAARAAASLALKRQYVSARYTLFLLGACSVPRTGSVSCMRGRTSQPGTH